jgi:hypothetical protein
MRGASLAVLAHQGDKFSGMQPLKTPGFLEYAAQLRLTRSAKLRSHDS